MTPKEYTHIKTHSSDGNMELFAKPGQENVSIEGYLRRDMVSYWNKYHGTEYPFEHIILVLDCVTKEKRCYRAQVLVTPAAFFTRTLEEFTAEMAEICSKSLCRTIGKEVEPKDIIEFATAIAPIPPSELDTIQEVSK